MHVDSEEVARESGMMLPANPDFARRSEMISPGISGNVAWWRLCWPRDIRSFGFCHGRGPASCYIKGSPRNCAQYHYLRAGQSGPMVVPRSASRS
jgi:hypothetical protein